MLFAVNGNEDEQRGADEETEQPHQLGNTHAVGAENALEDIERIGAQPFDEHSAETVPGKVEKQDLPVEFLFAVKQVEQDEAAKVPNALVKKGGMHVGERGGKLVWQQPHAQKGGNGNGKLFQKEEIARTAVNDLIAVGLAVEKVAPAPQHLREDDGGNDRVVEAENVDFFDFANDENTQSAAQHAAVNAEPAVPDGDHVVERMVFAQCGKHVVKARADNGKDDDDQADVDHVVGLDALVFLAAPDDVKEGQQHSQRDKQAVPADLKFAEQGKGHGV